MSNVNWKSVILGGLVAGLIINIGEFVLNTQVIAAQNAEAIKALGRSGEISGTQIAYFNVFGFVTGIAIVWLYAAIRPRYGAGSQTALCAGAMVWFLAFFLGSMPNLILDLFPIKLALIGWAWSLAELMLAGYAGGRVYKEEEVPRAASMAAVGSR